MSLLRMSWRDFAGQHYPGENNKKPLPLTWGKSDKQMHKILDMAVQFPPPPVEDVRKAIYQSFSPGNHIGICPILRNLAKRCSPLSPIRAWAEKNYKDRMDIWLNHPVYMRDALDELRRTAEINDGRSGLALYAYRTFYEQLDALIGMGFRDNPHPLAAVAEILSETVYLDPNEHDYTVTKNQSLPRFEKAMDRLFNYDPVLYLSTLAMASTYAGGSARFAETVAGIASHHLPELLETSKNQHAYLEFLYEAAINGSRTQQVYGRFLISGFHSLPDSKTEQRRTAVLVPHVH